MKKCLLLVCVTCLVVFLSHMPSEGSITIFKIRSNGCSGESTQEVFVKSETCSSSARSSSCSKPEKVRRVVLKTIEYVSVEKSNDCSSAARSSCSKPTRTKRVVVKTKSYQCSKCSDARSGVCACSGVCVCGDNCTCGDNCVCN